MTMIAPAEPLTERPAGPPRISLVTTAQAFGAYEERDVVRPVTLDGDLPCANSGTTHYGLWWDCPEGAGIVPEDVSLYGTNGKTGARPPGTKAFRPFDAWVAMACTGYSVGSAAGDYLTEKVTRLLDNRLSRIIEREAWLGERAISAGYPNDAYVLNVTSLNSGNALGYVTALAELEQAIGARSDEPWWIHVQRRVATAWLQNGLVVPAASGRYLVTPQGNVVVPGDGYPGSSPTGVAADKNQSWAYVTSPVTIHVGTRIRIGDQPGSHSIALNDVTLIAERPVVYAFHACGHTAVKVDLSRALG